MKILLGLYLLFSFFLPKLEKAKLGTGSNSLERLLADGTEELDSVSSR